MCLTRRQPWRLSDFLAQENHALFLAVDRDSQMIVGQVRGIVHYQPDGARQLYLDNLGVTGTRQRQGIGRALVERLLQWAEKTTRSNYVGLGPSQKTTAPPRFTVHLGFKATTHAYTKGA